MFAIFLCKLIDQMYLRVVQIGWREVQAECVLRIGTLGPIDRARPLLAAFIPH
jgi:hypothetical protein